MSELTLAVYAAELEQSAVLAMESTLREGGFVPSPTLHLISDQMGPTQYAGFVQSRSYYQGEDAHRALVDLALVASMTTASHVLLAWEQADLQVAVQSPGLPLPTGLVVLRASRGGEHCVSWHPAELAQIDIRPDGLPIVAAKWGSVRRVVGGQIRPWYWSCSSYGGPRARGRTPS